MDPGDGTLDHGGICNLYDLYKEVTLAGYIYIDDLNFQALPGADFEPIQEFLRLLPLIAIYTISGELLKK